MPATTLTITSIDDAMKGDDFWLKLDSEAARIVCEATARGYLVRLSHTQVQWTEAGLAKARAEVPPTYRPGLSLTDNLTAFGYTHAPDKHGRRDVVAPNGEVVFTGDYADVVLWLKAHNARGERPCPDCVVGRKDGALCLTCHGTPFLPLPRSA